MFENEVGVKVGGSEISPAIGTTRWTWCKTRQGPLFSALFTPQQVGGSNRALLVKTENSQARRGHPPFGQRHKTLARHRQSDAAPPVECGSPHLPLSVPTGRHDVAGGASLRAYEAENQAPKGRHERAHDKIPRKGHRCLSKDSRKRVTPVISKAGMTLLDQKPRLSPGLPMCLFRACQLSARNSTSCRLGNQRFQPCHRRRRWFRRPCNQRRRQQRHRHRHISSHRRPRHTGSRSPFRL